MGESGCDGGGEVRGEPGWEWHFEDPCTKGLSGGEEVGKVLRGIDGEASVGYAALGSLWQVFWIQGTEVLDV